MSAIAAVPSRQRPGAHQLGAPEERAALNHQPPDTRASMLIAPPAHDCQVIFKYAPKYVYGAGFTLPAGTVLAGCDGRETLSRAALVNAVHYTGSPGLRGEWILYYTYLTEAPAFAFTWSTSLFHDAAHLITANGVSACGVKLPGMSPPWKPVPANELWGLRKCRRCIHHERVEPLPPQ